MSAHAVPNENADDSALRSHDRDLIELIRDSSDNPVRDEELTVFL